MNLFCQKLGPPDGAKVRLEKICVGLLIAVDVVVVQCLRFQWATKTVISHVDFS